MCDAHGIWFSVVVRCAQPDSRIFPSCTSDARCALCCANRSLALRCGTPSSPISKSISYETQMDENNSRSLQSRSNVALGGLQEGGQRPSYPFRLPGRSCLLGKVSSYLSRSLALALTLLSLSPLARTRCTDADYYSLDSLTLTTTILYTLSLTQYLPLSSKMSPADTKVPSFGSRHSVW